MEFGYMGVRHVETPLAVRERVSFTDSKKTEFFVKMQRIGVRQCMVLSTCNRSEIFFFYQAEEPSPHGVKMWEQIRACYTGFFPGVDVAAYRQEAQGEEALVYLFRVTAGLESLVLGEDQILGQVVEALEFSQTMGASGKELNQVVRDAIRCAKRIKEEFRISERPLSVSYVGVRCLAAALARDGGASGRTILIIGSGKTAGLALTYLREYRPEAVYVCSRTMRCAREMGEHFPELKVVPYENRYRIMKQCDVIVSATASPHLVIRRDNCLAHILDGRRRYFLDLAAPRDIDARLGELPDIQIMDLDSLQKVTEENRRERERLAGESRSLVEAAVAETMEWFHMSRMDGTIESLQKRCHNIVEDSFAYLNRKLDLTVREQKIVRKVLNASLQRLLREPIQELKALETEREQEEYREVIQRLFASEGE